MSTSDRWVVEILRVSDEASIRTTYEAREWWLLVWWLKENEMSSSELSMVILSTSTHCLTVRCCCARRGYSDYMRQRPQDWCPQAQRLSDREKPTCCSHRQQYPITLFSTQPSRIAFLFWISFTIPKYCSLSYSTPSSLSSTSIVPLLSDPVDTS